MVKGNVGESSEEVRSEISLSGRLGVGWCGFFPPRYSLFYASPMSASAMPGFRKGPTPPSQRAVGPADPPSLLGLAPLRALGGSPSLHRRCRQRNAPNRHPRADLTHMSRAGGEAGDQEGRKGKGELGAPLDYRIERCWGQVLCMEGGWEESYPLERGERQIKKW